MSDITSQHYNTTLHAGHYTDTSGVPVHQYCSRRPYLQVMWRVACAVALLCVVTASDDDKRAELQPAPFVLGSRYGRSPPRTIAPRNDRFFMGSRYGKRSGFQAAGPPLPAPALLLCEYTGVAALYQCDARASYEALRARFTNRKNDEESEGEEV